MRIKTKKSFCSIMLALAIAVCLIELPDTAKAETIAPEEEMTHASTLLEAMEMEVGASVEIVIELEEGGAMQNELPPLNITDDITIPTNLRVEMVEDILPETLKPYAQHFVDRETNYQGKHAVCAGSSRAGNI